MQTLTEKQFAELSADLQEALLHRQPGNHYLHLCSYSTDNDTQYAHDLRLPTKPFNNLLGLEPGVHHGSGYLAYDTTTRMVVVEAKVTEDPVSYVRNLLISPHIQMKVYARTKQEFLFARELPGAWYAQLRDALKDFIAACEGSTLLQPTLGAVIHGHYHRGA